MQEAVLKELKPGVNFKDMHKLSAYIGIKGLKELGLLKGSCEEAVDTGVYGLFYPHGLGHMLGLDVHDMESLGEDLVGYNENSKREVEFGMTFLRLGKKLERGFCITVEPGIYFIPELFNQWKKDNKHSNCINYDKFEKYLDFGGIRIEDNVLITNHKSENLSEFIIKEVDDIESIMKE
jgi:Xaa-Pro aminopeptidase